MNGGDEFTTGAATGAAAAATTATPAAAAAGAVQTLRTPSTRTVLQSGDRSMQPAIDRYLVHRFRDAQSCFLALFRRSLFKGQANRRRPIEFDLGQNQ